MGGLVAGINSARLLYGQPLLAPPRTTMLGALLYYITHAEPTNFQPMKAAMGLFPPLEEAVRNKRARYGTYTERATAELAQYLAAVGFAAIGAS